MESKKSNLIYMNNSDLEKLSKSELIQLILKQNARQPIEKMDDKPRKRPVPTPRKSVKDMVQQYEDHIISQPSEKPIPAPRTKKPVPEKRTIISQVEKALKGYTQSFDVELRDKKDPLLQ